MEFHPYGSIGLGVLRHFSHSSHLRHDSHGIYSLPSDQKEHTPRVAYAGNLVCGTMTSIVCYAEYT